MQPHYAVSGVVAWKRPTHNLSSVLKKWAPRSGRILAVQAAARAPSGRKRKATPEEETYRTIMEAEPWAPKRAKK